MPFQSKAQMRACFAKNDPDWDCREWADETANPKKLPEKKTRNGMMGEKPVVDSNDNSSKKAECLEYAAQLLESALDKKSFVPASQAPPQEPNLTQQQQGLQQQAQSDASAPVPAPTPLPAAIPGRPVVPQRPVQSIANNTLLKSAGPLGLAGKTLVRFSSRVPALLQKYLIPGASVSSVAYSNLDEKRLLGQSLLARLKASGPYVATGTGVGGALLAEQALDDDNENKSAAYSLASMSLLDSAIARKKKPKKRVREAEEEGDVPVLPLNISVRRRKGLAKVAAPLMGVGSPYDQIRAKPYGTPTPGAARRADRAATMSAARQRRKDLNLSVHTPVMPTKPAPSAAPVMPAGAMANRSMPVMPQQPARSLASGAQIANQIGVGGGQGMDIAGLPPSGAQIANRVNMSGRQGTNMANVSPLSRSPMGGSLENRPVRAARPQSALSELRVGPAAAPLSPFVASKPPELQAGYANLERVLDRADVRSRIRAARNAPPRTMSERMEAARSNRQTMADYDRMLARESQSPSANFIRVESPAPALPTANNAPQRMGGSLGPLPTANAAFNAAQPTSRSTSRQVPEMSPQEIQATVRLLRGEPDPGATPEQIKSMLRSGNIESVFPQAGERESAQRTANMSRQEIMDETQSRQARLAELTRQLGEAVRGIPSSSGLGLGLGR